jgi:sugar diacid utilization regulator
VENEKKTAFRCADLLGLASMRGSRLLAGKKSLDKEVKRANIIEVPDIINWVHEHEFLITTGYPFKDDEAHLLATLGQLHKKGVAALGIKPKRFIENISQEIIDRAAALDMPLIELPIDANFSDIVLEVTREALSREEKTPDSEQNRQNNLEAMRKRNAFLQKWLTGSLANAWDIGLEAHNCGITVPASQKYVVAIAAKAFSERESYTENEMYRVARLISESGGDFFASRCEGELVFILPDKGREKELLTGFKDSFYRNTQKPDIRFCVSGAYKTPEAYLAYAEAKRVLHVVTRCGVEGEFIRMSDLGIYAILSLLEKSDEVRAFVDGLIRPLSEYDASHNGQLYATLKVYLKMNCNARLTAERLFTHYNTVAYRLDKLRDILKMDVDDPEVQLQLRIAMKLADMF